MKVLVIVSLKPTILDPQGSTIQKVVSSLGFTSVDDLRQGKVFEIKLKNKLPKKLVREQIEKLAKEILINPVIEEYKILWK